ncbi:hypothetical protein ACFLV3_03170 [Chloroflexota bacterium]
MLIGIYGEHKLGAVRHYLKAIKNTDTQGHLPCYGFSCFDGAEVNAYGVLVIKLDGFSL